MRDMPQRITPKSPPGALFKRRLGATAARERHKDAAERDAIYETALRHLPCLKCAMEPCYEVHHVRANSAAHGKTSAAGKRQPSRWALPLCGACHRVDDDSLHKIGDDLFFYLLGTDPLQVCEDLYAQHGDPVAMRAVIECVIAHRKIHIGLKKET